jgi:hypothetical protein
MKVVIDGQEREVEWVECTQDGREAFVLKKPEETWLAVKPFHIVQRDGAIVSCWGGDTMTEIQEHSILSHPNTRIARLVEVPIKAEWVYRLRNSSGETTWTTLWNKNRPDSTFQGTVTKFIEVKES